jgi:hypothetical protein
MGSQIDIASSADSISVICKAALLPNWDEPTFIVLREQQMLTAGVPYARLSTCTASV